MVLKSFIGYILIWSSCTTIKKLGNTSSAPLSVTKADSTFVNPLLASGPDPWVIQKDTNYYYTNTFGNKIAIFKTNKMSDLKTAQYITVWTPPSTGSYSKEIWAPELHYLQGKWYIYFAA